MKKFLRLGLPFLIVLLVAGLATGDVSYVIQQVSQSGTWTVQPGNTANTTPWLFTVSQGGNSATVDAGGALKVDASASTQPVSGTVTVTQGTGTNLHTVVDSGTVTVTDGSGALNVIVDSGTTAVTQATASNLNAQVVGAAANGASVSGNPVIAGRRATTSEPAAVTDGQAVYSQADTVGRSIVSIFASRGQRAMDQETITDTNDHTIISADATYKSCITKLIITKDDVTTAVTLDFTSGAGGTNLASYRIAASNNQVIIDNFIWPVCTAVNTALVAKASAAVSTLYVKTVTFKTVD